MGFLGWLGWCFGIMVAVRMGGLGLSDNAG